MTNHKVKCSNFEIANDKPFTLIAGPCQLENEQHAIKMSTELKKITSELGINLIYKTSFDKANRTSLKGCLLYTSPSPRDAHESRMPSSA